MYTLLIQGPVLPALKLPVTRAQSIDAIPSTQDHAISCTYLLHTEKPQLSHKGQARIRTFSSCRTVYWLSL
uniref:Uncharacterized protein n=1 Tax=Anguilla anguilla TaxID=7936 RepID=A0A0E9P669_ANGAN